MNFLPVKYFIIDLSEGTINIIKVNSQVNLITKVSNVTINSSKWGIITDPVEASYFQKWFYAILNLMKCSTISAFSITINITKVNIRFI